MSEKRNKNEEEINLWCAKVCFFSLHLQGMFVLIHLVCCLHFIHASLLKTVPVEFGFIKFIAALQEIDIETAVYVIDFHQNTHARQQ